MHSTDNDISNYTSRAELLLFNEIKLDYSTLIVTFLHLATGSLERHITPAINTINETISSLCHDAFRSIELLYIFITQEARQTTITTIASNNTMLPGVRKALSNASSAIKRLSND